MIELKEYIKKGCFTIVISEPHSEMFLWGKDVYGDGILVKIDNNELDNMIDIAEETKIARKIMKEKYAKAVEATK